MIDERSPFYAPDHRAIPHTKTRPAERLFEFVRTVDHVAVVCELLYHGEWGVEAKFYQAAEFWYSHRFNTRALTVQWPELEREA